MLNSTELGSMLGGPAFCYESNERVTIRSTYTMVLYCL